MRTSTAMLCIRGVDVLLAFLLKVLTKDRHSSSLGFRRVMLRFQLQVLILINSSVLCYCVLIGRAKHRDRT